jgi:hypothetical protein
LVKSRVSAGRSKTSRRHSEGLQDDRELAVLGRDLEQALCLQALLPQRCAPARVGARDQQRSAGVLTEAGAEQGAAGELGDDQVLDLLRVDQHHLGESVPVEVLGVGQVHDDPVVRPDRVGLELELVTDAGAERESPGGVDAPAVRGEHAQPPVADLIAEAFDHDRVVTRHHARGVTLLAQELDEVACRTLIEVVALLEFLGILVDRPA